MFALLATMLVGLTPAEQRQFLPLPQLKPAPAVVIPKVVPKPLPKARATESVTVMGHSHRCPNGHVWAHTDASFGNRAAHTCPVCGAGPVWSVYQSRVPVTIQRPVPPVRQPRPRVQHLDCPT